MGTLLRVADEIFTFSRAMSVAPKQSHHQVSAWALAPSSYVLLLYSVMTRAPKRRMLSTDYMAFFSCVDRRVRISPADPGNQDGLRGSGGGRVRALRQGTRRFQHAGQRQCWIWISAFWSLAPLRLKFLIRRIYVFLARATERRGGALHSVSERDN